MTTPAGSRPASERPTAGDSAPNGSTPEGSVYRDPSVLRSELDLLFYPNWLCVGREEEIPRPGDFVTRDVGPENLLFVRATDGRVRGFYNLCRHRGTRVVEASHGEAARSFLCPYHAWSYDLEGRLLGAPHMPDTEEFHRAEYGLHPIRVESAGGFLWANLDPNAPDFAGALGPFLAKFARVPLADLRRGAHQEYEVAANWKILVENFSECYHCAPVHPGLNRITPYLSGANDATFHPRAGRSLFAGGYMELAGDYQSMTRTGYTDRPRLPGVTAEDARRIYYYVVFPNLFFSLHPDYVMVHRCWPVSPTHSRVENDFYFAATTVADPGFDPSDAVGMWDEINRQDWHVCELAQLGMGSRAWTGGRYSAKEELVRDFDAFVREELERGRSLRERR